jgi:hypothetical protein
MAAKKETNLSTLTESIDGGIDSYGLSIVACSNDNFVVMVMWTWVNHMI